MSEMNDQTGATSFCLCSQCAAQTRRHVAEDLAGRRIHSQSGFEDSFFFGGIARCFSARSGPVGVDVARAKAASVASLCRIIGSVPIRGTDFSESPPTPSISRPAHSFAWSRHALRIAKRPGVPRAQRAWRSRCRIESVPARDAVSSYDGAAQRRVRTRSTTALTGIYPPGDRRLGESVRRGAGLSVVRHTPLVT